MYKFIYDFHNIIYFINKKKKNIIIVYIYINFYKNNNLKIKNIINLLKKSKISIKILKTKKNNILKNNNICVKIKYNKLQKKINKNKIINLIKNNKLILILENINDPRNLGSCIRCADSAGIKLIFITKKNTCNITDTVIKTSCGSINNLDIIRVDNILYILKIIKNNNIYIFGTSDKSNSIIYNNRLKFPLAVIFGSEEYGITEKVKKYCNNIIKIPMYGYVKSLNISVSVGIFLFESIRQNFFNK